MRPHHIEDSFERFAVATFSPSQVGENKTQTLIMWGDSDQSFPGSPFSDVVNVLGSGVIAKEVEDGGHALPYEQPELVNQTILEFIGR
jgi:pimeloyl-ACP methyl ester carboxylesterase